MLSIENITCTLDGNPILRGVDLTVNSGEILCLLGPSGCGKTTLLRIIAGLETPDTGDVRLLGDSMLNIPVHQRSFGLMFQENALFPHLNVAENITFGLRMKGTTRDRQQQRLKEILSLVGLQGFEQRDVTVLSGGEQQRIALARSLAPNPCLLMLDEPLGSLDARLRKQLVTELRAMIKDSVLTAIYVTHDQHEAFAVADRIAVMNDGRIEQVGTAESLYRHPVSAFVATFMGPGNVVPVLRSDDTHVYTAIGKFAVVGQPDMILLHPDGISLAENDGQGTVSGHITKHIFVGSHYEMEIIVETAPDTSITLSFVLPAINGADHALGDRVTIYLQPDHIQALKK